MRIIVAATFILAHAWYPWACCHEQHCHPVPRDSIKAVELGLSWNGVVFTEPMIKGSLDERCHVCIGVAGQYRYPYCIFLPKPKPA